MQASNQHSARDLRNEHLKFAVTETAAGGIASI